MGHHQPRAVLDRRYSSEHAAPTPWSEAQGTLEAAKVYWLSTVRADGRPHVTSIAAVWLDGAVHFTTGEDEQKAKNLGHNPNVVVTIGSSELTGIDVVVEGQAVRVTDPSRLQRLADAYIPKYGDLFIHRVRDGTLYAEGAEGEVFAFEVKATKAFAFGKGESFSQTRWRFDGHPGDGD